MATGQSVSVLRDTTRCERYCPRNGNPHWRNQPVSSFHDLEMQSIQGQPVPFSDYQGKVCLIVNLASA